MIQPNMLLVYKVLEIMVLEIMVLVYKVLEIMVVDVYTES